MAEKKLIDPNEFWDRLNKASYDVITYPDREMDSPQFGYYTDTIQAVLNQTKKVDAVEVVNGRWVNAAGGRTICNNCGEYPLYDYFGRQKFSNYCPNCGAKKIDGERKDNE